VFTDMKKWTQIRLDVLRDEISKREIIRREGIHWETLKKILAHPQPPGYRMKEERPKPKICPSIKSGSLRSSKKTKVTPKSSVTRPSASMIGSRRWVIRVTPGFALGLVRDCLQRGWRVRDPGS